MKVLHIKSTLEIGGAERLMVDILPLMNKEIDVELLINYRTDNAFYRKLIENGVIVNSLDYPNLYCPWNIVKLIPWLRKYDLIHVHLFPSLYFVAIANLFIGKTLVYTEHSTYNKRRSKWYFRLIEKWIYSRYSKIISISQLTENKLKSWIDVKDDDKRFVIIPNGVDIERFRNCCHSMAYQYTIIMIGRFVPAKDQRTIIMAMKLLNKDVHLILVGDGENRKKCEQLAYEIDVSDRVHFVGEQADIPGWIAKADIGIQSSNWEGFGLTAVEMMAGGLPVIATDVDGLKQIVEGAGVLFNVGDYQQLSNIIMQMMNDKSYYEMIKNRCINRAMCYDISIMMKEYIRVYKEFK